MVDVDAERLTRCLGEEADAIEEAQSSRREKAGQYGSTIEMRHVTTFPECAPILVRPAHQYVRRGGSSDPPASIVRAPVVEHVLGDHLAPLRIGAGGHGETHRLVGAASKAFG
jgi:hypothetical protein